MSLQDITSTLPHKIQGLYTDVTNNTSVKITQYDSLVRVLLHQFREIRIFLYDSLYMFHMQNSPIQTYSDFERI